MMPRSSQFNGRETFPVERPGFKPGGWRHASLGGFDSHTLPPKASSRLLRDGDTTLLR